MLKCPVCGFRNPQSNNRCLKCSALLKRDTDLIDQAMYEGARKAKDYQRHSILAVPIERIRRTFDFPSWRVRDDLPYRFPFTAGFLTIVPGLGQFYNGQPSKGLALGAVWAVWLAVCIVTIKQPYSNWLLLLLTLGWLLVWNDAIGTSVRTNGQRWSLRNGLAMLCALLFFLGIGLSLMQFFGMSFLTLVRVRQAVHEPTIRAGDRVWVNHLSYWFANADYGDVIYFDPDRFVAETGGERVDVYSINIGRYFQRVIGKAGDTIERHRDRWYRNGSPIPEWQAPFGDEVITTGTFHVPEGCVFAPITYIPSEAGIGGLIEATGKGSFSIVGFAFQPGFIFQKWEEASMPSYDKIWGRAVAVVDPPPHRSWLKP